VKSNFILAVIFATALFTGTTTQSDAQTQSGIASVYTTKQGSKTASGKRLNDGALTQKFVSPTSEMVGRSL
jgi:rare lipoprotein A (peptidoglycan hydrolase)